MNLNHVDSNPVYGTVYPFYLCDNLIKSGKGVILKIMSKEVEKI